MKNWYDNFFVHQGQWLKDRVQQCSSINAFLRASGLTRTRFHEWSKMDRVSMRPDLFWAMLKALSLDALITDKERLKPGARVADLLDLVIARTSNSPEPRREKFIRGFLDAPEEWAKEAVEKRAAARRTPPDQKGKLPKS